jgi:hypothetical protein
MSMKIHDPATDNDDVPVPDGWPDLNVSQFQKDKSLGKEVDADRLVDLLTIAAVEVVGNFDMDVLTLPLEGTEAIYFRLAVFELAFSKLLPSLPVNNQHDSNMADPEGMTRRIVLLKRNTMSYQNQIRGFKPKPTIGSMVIDAETTTT